MSRSRGAGSFGGRSCKSLRIRYFKFGVEALPRSWRRRWMIARIVATPYWVDMREVRKVYEKAKELTDSTGKKHVVDHDIPLQHPLVCGLHVAKNLQVLTEKQNEAKGNRWMPDQLELVL